MEQTKVVNLAGRPSKTLNPNEVYIGRRQTQGGWDLPDSPWANPYPVKTYGRDECLILYRDMIQRNPEMMKRLEELRGKTLACWCHPQPCHGDILIELMNKQ
ncbi:DUF4326 domain-containing protein [Candidatus Dojkabacteria bacterium]|uniref:DUF4326 domain-containing protein n=1 Tax=Candidatus Dojkabacteria bacterium TaxID=2099670 RepID=A0A5C7JAB3_9BACT|nr:MAG: DUF4326 domain-containing protein [Candidatus Dojkabacteria bacterium]